MPKVPNNPVSQAQSQALKDIVVEDIQRIDLTFFYKVSYLPANAPVMPEHPNEFSDDLGLNFQILAYRNAVFVFLA